MLARLALNIPNCQRSPACSLPHCSSHVQGYRFWVALNKPYVRFCARFRVSCGYSFCGNMTVVIAFALFALGRASVGFLPYRTTIDTYVAAPIGK